MKNLLLPVAATAGLLVLAVQPSQAANLVANGSFESNGGVGQITSGVSSLSNWSVGATTDGSTYPFVFVADSAADSTGFPSKNSPPNILLWGPGTPSGTSAYSYSVPNPHQVGPVANGFGASPDGGDFLGADAAYANAPVSQTINGLNAGQDYTLSFYYAGAQFTDATGANTEGWHVTFGTDSVDTPTLNNASQGFTGWQTFSTTFTATSASQVLTFLATGGPSGLPPFALLDGVTLTGSVPPPPPPPDAPEPASMGLAVSGLLGVFALGRRMKNRS